MNELITKLNTKLRTVQLKTVLSNVFVSSSSSSGTGDVTGPSSSTADNIATFNGATGKIIKDGGSKISDLVLKTTTVNGQALTGNIVIPTLLHYMRSGSYLVNSINAAAPTTTAIQQNSLRAFPFIVSRSITFTEITTEVTTQVGSTTYRFGLYTDNGSGYPDALVSGTDVQTYDSSTLGVKSSGTVGITIAPGLYWVAVNSNGAPTLRGIAVASMPATLGVAALAASSIITRWAVNLTYQAMPNNFPAGATGNANTTAIMIGLMI